MSGTSAAHLILFCASLVIAASVAGTVLLEVDQFTDAVEVQGSGVSEEIETDIAFISDANQTDAIVDEEEGELVLYVKNTGGTDITADPTRLDIVADGTFVSNDDLEVDVVDTEADTWRPGDVVELRISDPGPEDVSGDTWITITVNGNDDRIDFNIAED